MPIDTNGATTFPHVEWHKAVLFAALEAAKVERIVCGWALPDEFDVPRADGRHHWRQQDVVGKWCHEGVLFVARFEAEGEEYRTATVTLLTILIRAHPCISYRPRIPTSFRVCRRPWNCRKQ
jgi:hypothetical protein